MFLHYCLSYWIYEVIYFHIVGFYKRMNQKMQAEPEGKKYRVFDNQTRKSSQAVKEIIEKYLDEWEALASQVPIETKANVADIS